MRLRALSLAIFAVAIGAPATALVPLGCFLEGPDRTMVNGTDGTSNEGDSFVTVEDLSGGFVGWGFVTDLGSGRYVLQSCVSGDELILDVPAPAMAAVTAQYEEMVYGERAYTLPQIADATEELGAYPRLLQNTQGDCACRILGITE